MANVAATALAHNSIAEGYARAASFYLMFAPDARTIYSFADCSLNVNPNPAQLAEIAINTAATFEGITGRQARVAFLSFSTHGSAKQDSAEKVQEAVAIAQKQAPHLQLDGALQFDAAIDTAVAQKKAPNGSLNGKANVFIFPSLNSANIGQKIAEHMGGFVSIGPILQGFTYPVHHLAKSCTVEGIINSVVLASYMKIKNK